MSEDKNNLHQDEGALRIMEALSAVDEELLERSGMPVAADGTNGQDDGKVTDMSLYKKRVGTFRRYGRICAACLALAVVGVISWNGLSPSWMRMGSSAPNSSGSGQMTGGSTNGAAEQAMDGTAMDNYTAGADAGYGAAESYEEAGNLQMITEEQARASDSLGTYLPRQLPAGYVFESAQMDDQGQLYLCWSHGMDTIRISVTFAEVGGLKTADVSRPETYDVQLYEPPYGETVPKEYWETFDDPIFWAEDLSLEVVSSRMMSYEDAGDTDTPRGRFSVLYPEGVLVGFDGDGTAEEIWDMFASLQE